MPTYEYQRPDGTTFEVVQGFDEQSLTEDPETGVPVRRVLHPPAVHFKGKGFYTTDYGTRKRQRESAGRDGAAAGAKQDGGGDSGGGGDSRGGGDSGGSSSSAGSDGASAAASEGPAKSGTAETSTAVGGK